MTAKDRTKIDLISFDSEMSIEKQRWEMTAHGQGRVRLRNLCQAQVWMKIILANRFGCG